MTFTTLSSSIYSHLAHRPSLSLINFLVTLMVVVGVVIFVKRFIHKNHNVGRYVLPVYQFARLPLTLLIASYIFYYFIGIVSLYFPIALNNKTRELINYLLSGIGIIPLFWLIYNIVTLGREKLILWADNHNHPTISACFNHAGYYFRSPEWSHAYF